MPLQFKQNSLSKQLQFSKARLLNVSCIAFLEGAIRNTTTKISVEFLGYLTCFRTVRYFKMAFSRLLNMAHYKLKLFCWRCNGGFMT